MMNPALREGLVAMLGPHLEEHSFRLTFPHYPQREPFLLMKYVSVRIASSTAHSLLTIVEVVMTTPAIEMPWPS